MSAEQLEVKQPRKRILIKGILGSTLMISSALTFENLDNITTSVETASLTLPSQISKEQEVLINRKNEIKIASLAVFGIGAIIGLKNFWKLIK